jgi:tetratricopeptide (TPR) repeat protein
VHGNDQHDPVMHMSNKMTMGPVAIDALYGAGYWLHSNGRWNDAAAVFRAVVIAAPTDERGWLGLGDAHERLGQERLALEIYAMGSAAAAPSPRCDLAIGRVLRALDRADEAHAAFARAARAADDLGDPSIRAIAQSELEAR